MAAVRRLDNEQGVVSIAEVARGFGRNPNVLAPGRREGREGPGQGSFSGNGETAWGEGRVEELERKVGQQALAIDF